MLGDVSEEQTPKYELARQVVVGFAAGLTAGYAGPMAGAAAAGAAPAVLAGMDFIAATVGKRRVDHATETVIYAAEEFGAETSEDFVEFVKKAVCDEEHQELLARSLTIAQDTAMRDKRRALGRALAAAASETGTKVDTEMLFIRVLADLDEPHVRLLRIMSTVPPHMAQGDVRARQWYPSSIAQADPGLADVVWSLFGSPERHGLIWSAGEYHVPGGAMEPQYEITQYGEWFLTRLAEPE